MQDEDSTFGTSTGSGVPRNDAPTFASKNSSHVSALARTITSAASRARSGSAVAAGKNQGREQATSWRRRPPTIRRARSLVKITPGLTAVAPCWGEMAGKARAAPRVFQRFSLDHA